MEIPTTKNQAFSFKHGCMLLCFATLWSPYLALRDCEFPAIFNFGDSNSDTGAMSAAYIPFTPPYGETYFGKPSGRFSDGRLIIDFLASDLGLPFLHAYLDSLGADYNFKQGANFAVGGSTIKPLGRILISYFNLSPLYLDIELTQFSEFIPRSQTIRKQGGMFAKLMPSNESFSRALYTIDMSQNDFGNGFADNTIEEVNATVPDLVKLISTHVQGLYNLGARSFWIHNAAPIGCLAYILSPAKLKRHQIDRAGCGIPFNDVVQYYNQKLKEEVIALREALPDAFITYVDIYSIKYSFFRWPRWYGFKSPLSVCCGAGGGTYNFIRTRPCGYSPSCSDPSVKVVWDGTHYTEAANKLVFDLLNTGEFSDPPVPPRFACPLNAQEVTNLIPSTEKTISQFGSF